MEIGIRGNEEGGIEDEELVRCFQEGDRSAFDQLAIRHGDRTVNLCRWFLGDFDEACDAAQDVLVKVLNGLDKFRFQSSFSTWLYKIATNTCKNRMKTLEFRFKRFKVRFSSPGDDDQGIFDLEDDRPTPIETMEEKERRALVRKAVDSLAPKYRTVVVLRDLEALSYEEVAEVAGLNIGTVKSRLARGRKALYESLKNVFGDELQRS
jgi:RNA polymerase sigma-70 factor (ECF subfamily)